MNDEMKTVNKDDRDLRIRTTARMKEVKGKDEG
jgi:hypothetical protein